VGATWRHNQDLEAAHGCASASSAAEIEFGNVR